MKAFNGKPIIAIILMMCLNIGISMAQTGTTKHIVDRGETLESIAKKYGTTPEKIIELNPESYYVDKVPIEFNWLLWGVLNVCTFLVSMTMLIGPSYLISRIYPAVSLRFE